MAFKFTCPQCGHSEYMAGFSYGKCSACGWAQWQPIQPPEPEAGDRGDGSETWRKFFSIILTNRAIAKHPEYYGHNESAANQILDLLDVIDSYSKERKELEAENKALRELARRAAMLFSIEGSRYVGLIADLKAAAKGEALGKGAGL